MNSIDDIAKMAIQEIGNQLEQMNKKQNEPKPLRAANSAQSLKNSLANDKENLENSLANDKENLENSVFDEKENLENLAQTINEIDDLNKQDYKTQNEKIYSNQANSEDERLFLTNLKERIEVLFAGLKANDNDMTLRLELTIRFLEFLLAKTNERLSNIQK